MYNIVNNDYSKTCQTGLKSLPMDGFGKFKVFGQNFSSLLERAEMNPNSLAKRLNEDPALMWKISKGKQSASERLMKKFMEVEELVQAGLDTDEMLRWKAMDKFPDLPPKQEGNRFDSATNDELIALMRLAIKQNPALKDVIRREVLGE